MADDLTVMSKQDLIDALRALQTADRSRPADETARLVHELELHQVELEMQNRALLEAQMALEKSRRRYQDLYDLAPIAYFTLDRKGRIREANVTAATLFGGEAADLIGKFLVAYVGRTDRRRYREHLRRCLDEGLPGSAELELSLPDPFTTAIRITSTPLLEGDGRVSGCRTTLTDVSALKRSERRLALLASVSRKLGARLDDETHVVSVLPALVPELADVALLDLAAEPPSGEVTRVGRAFADDVARARFAPAKTTAEPSLGARAPQRHVLATGRPIFVPDGARDSRDVAGGLDDDPLLRAIAPASLIFVPLVSRNAILGVLTLLSTDPRRSFSGDDLSLAEDLSARFAAAIDNARLYRQARDALKARDEMLTFVAHDLRNPVHAILLSSASLLESAPKPERRRGWRSLDRMHRMGEQMIRLIDDLLDVSKLDAGALAVEMDDRDDRELIRDVFEVMQPAAEDKSVDLRAHLPARPSTVRCDRDRVRQLFSSVVGNALELTRSGGAITIASRAAAEEIVFTVRDTGPAISASDVARLFSRSWPADSRAHKGRGFGLFIAKRLVEAQGGRIWAEEESDKGAAISFSLPRAPVPKVAPSSPGEDDGALDLTSQPARTYNPAG